MTERAGKESEVAQHERAGKEPEGAQHERAAPPNTTRIGLPPTHPLAWLQRTAGNAAVARLLESAREGQPGQSGTPNLADRWMGGAASVQRVLQVASHPPTVQRQGKGSARRPRHLTGKQVDGYLMASTFLKPYIKPKMTAGTTAEGAVEIHDAADFKAEWIAYAMTKINPDTGNKYTEKAARRAERNINAFQGGGKIHLHTRRGERATTIHESMHLFSSTSFISAVGYNVNEGSTEYFTRVVTREQRIGRGNFYPPQQRSVKKLVGISSQEKLANAYFNGSLGDIKTDADAKGAGTWDKWLGYMKGGKYVRANALIR